MTKTIPDEILKWIEAGAVLETHEMDESDFRNPKIQNIQNAFRRGATAMYNRDREEIEEKDKRIFKLEKLIEQMIENQKYI